MKKRVQVFEVQKDGTAKKKTSFDVDGATVDDQAKAARERLAGCKIRSLRHGPDKILAYVEPKK